MIRLNAHAKINLSLDVLSRRDDGYHNLQMLMQTIELHDTILLEEIPNGIEIDCEAQYVPANTANIAYKAAELMLEKYSVDRGVKITIDKRIPVAAGLAGGSSDAAAVLKGMNQLFNLNVGQEELMKIGKSIGADVPYCILGGTALAEGIGEVLTVLNPLREVPIILIKPRVGVPTAWVYGNLDLNNLNYRPDTEMLVTAIKKNDIYFVAQNMKNVLESVTIAKHRVISEIKQSLIANGAIGSMMSGSGPSVFGIFDNEEKAKDAFLKLDKGIHECFLTKIIKV